MAESWGHRTMSDSIRIECTVEQQGCLTLHLHMLVWIQGALCPEGMWQQINDLNSEFCHSLIKYLESCHAGEFITGDMDTVAAKVKNASARPDYQDPTETLPTPLPELCTTAECPGCKKCQALHKWTMQYEETVDDLILKSNVHSRTTNQNKDGSENKTQSFKGCLDNIWGQ